MTDSCIHCTFDEITLGIYFHMNLVKSFKNFIDLYKCGAYIVIHSYDKISINMCNSFRLQKLNQSPATAKRRNSNYLLL